MFKVNNKDTRVSIVNFEHVIAGWGITDTGISSNFKIKHSNYENWNNERIYILPSWVIVLFSTFQQNNFILFFAPISAFETIMTVTELTKIAIYQATA